MNSRSKLALSTSFQLMFLSLILGPLSAYAQTNAELIEQEIQSAEKSIETTKKFIKQLLWNEVPNTQSQTQEHKESSSAIVVELTELSAQVEKSEAKLEQTKSQLRRSERILDASKQELAQVKQEIKNLEMQKQVSIDQLSNQTQQNALFEQQSRDMDVLIESSKPELERLKTILATAQEQVQRRDQQAQHLQQTETQFHQELALKQSQLDSQAQEIMSLRARVQDIDQKMNDEQSDWSKLGKQIAERADKREGFETRLAANQREIEKVKQERDMLLSELSKAKLATSERRTELSEAKSNFAIAKKNVKASEQQLRRAKTDMKGDQSAESRELELHHKLLSDIRASVEMTNRLERNDADMQLEIRQLEKRLEAKNQSIAPLKQRTEQLQQQRQAALQRQHQQQQSVDDTSAKLIATEERYQSAARDLRVLNEEPGANN